MLLSQMIAAVRRDIREPSAITVGDTQIQEVMDLGAERVWEALVRGDGTLGRSRASLQSNSHVFSLPSNVLILNQVWDMGKNALSITAASNASPIVLTFADVSTLNNDDRVLVNGVLGNTAANGTWKLANKNLGNKTVELVGSTGSGAWTSGGKLFVETSSFSLMGEINPEDATGSDKGSYIIRNAQIVIDHSGFSNDLIIDFIRTSENGYLDIPARYHIFLCAFAVTQLLRFPSKQDSNYDDIKSMMDYNMSKFKVFMESIANLQKQSSSPKRMKDSIGWSSLW